jgi:hypothetical protein
MRTACVYIPSFPLQAALVGHRDLTDGGAVAVVVQPQVGSPVVVACSRAAWNLGVRPGMSATVARTAAPELDCVIADVAAERALLKAVAEATLGISPRVELGGDPRGQHHVMYVEVPSGRRGSWFGGKLRDLLAIFGLRGRIGIADDRFTAYVAAAQTAREREGDASDEAVVCVPRGGSAAFLAPQPLALLQLGPEVLHMLEALGVRTLGAFADLPPPSVARPDRTAAWDLDFQALARGDGGSTLDAYTPSGPIAERMMLEPGGPSVGAAVEALARRLSARLLGRGAVPADVLMRLERSGGLPAIRSLHVAEASPDDLADVIGRALGTEPWTRIEIIARPVAAAQPVQAAAPAPEPMRHEVDPIAPLVLLPSAFGERMERVEHRRTRRGKQRPRIGAGQARLFVGE